MKLDAIKIEPGLYHYRGYEFSELKKKEASVQYAYASDFTWVAHKIVGEGEILQADGYLLICDKIDDLLDDDLS